MKWLVTSILMFLSVSSAWSHPVAYEDAFSFMSLNTEGKTDNTLVYSPKWWFGTGIQHVQTADDKHTNLHLGLLLKRWNNWESQGNFYLFGGPGIQQRNNEEKYFTRYGAQVDWETRRIYTLMSYSAAQSKDFGGLENFEGRLGFAPFLAGFKDLNIWAILQVDHSPQAKNETEVTPLVRMFYKNVLWEMGSSLRGSWLLNFMVRY
ncbi:MAG: hypothetical protein Fur0010_26420 [Bdellovibrio sp.]